MRHRRVSARTLTDAVLVPEVGQVTPMARSGFQVRFVELPIHSMAIGGVLLADQQEPSDVLSAWPASRFRVPKVRAFVDCVAEHVRM